MSLTNSIVKQNSKSQTFVAKLHQKFEVCNRLVLSYFGHT